jgi:hypothetical protein
MTTTVDGATGGRVFGPEDGDIRDGMGGLTDRFILSAAETNGGFALVEQPEGGAP